NIFFLPPEMKTQSAKQPKLCSGCRKLRVVVIFIIPLFFILRNRLFEQKSQSRALFREKLCLCLRASAAPTGTHGRFVRVSHGLFRKNKDLSKDRSLFWQMTLILIETR